MGTENGKYTRRPRANDKPDPAGSQSPNRLNWINVNLSNEDEIWLSDNWDSSTSLLADFIAESDDYGGLSVKEDKNGGGKLAILYGGETPETFAGYALTGRGTTAYDALYALAYKHLIKLGRKWPTQGTAAKGRFG